MAKSGEDRRLVRLTKICLELPEATRECHGRHATFRVRKKVFAYFLNDHHGDGIVSVSCKALPHDNQALVAGDPVRFYLPAYIGPRGWVGLRLDVGKIDWDEVSELVAGSYKIVGPEKLAAQVILT
jgi:predicted DNA-binding protein (MmcQ/YjbR family)